MSKFEFRPPRVDDGALKSVSEDKETRLNIVVPQSMLQKLKRMAIDKNITLRELVTDQLLILLNENMSN